MLRGKKILIGITASIAAYKTPLLIRLFKKAGAEVSIVLTPDAHGFVTPLTLSVLSGHNVLTEPFDKKTGSWNSHVDLGLWADVFVIAPLTANTLAKMAAGIADNLLLTTYLSAKCKVYFAPAMDLDMFRHQTTSTNIQKLVERGNILIDPKEGELASGLCGEGRMEEPEGIFNIIVNHFEESNRLSGKKVLITAGPTYEKIDPVRFIGNFSSGLMGFELATSFAEKNAEVYLVTGPTQYQSSHPNIYRIDVTTAEEMYNACIELQASTDIVIMAAAVADFIPVNVASQKIKKKEDNFSIKLKKTKDILADLGKNKSENQVLAGFALETNDELKNAASKLKNKNLDLIVLNSLNDKEAGFGKKTNKVTILDRNGNMLEYPAKSKREVARDILDYIITTHFNTDSDNS